MIKIILPAGEIPLGSEVTRPTGKAVFTLRDQLNVYRENGTKQEVFAGPGARFLVASNGNANAIGLATELVWRVEAQDFIEYLEGPSQ